MKLAFEVVKTFYGEKFAKDAQENFESTFSKGGVPDDIVKIVGTGKSLADILIEADIVSSKNELRRLIESGSVTNMTSGKKIESIDETFSESSDIKVGKRRFVKIEI